MQFDTSKKKQQHDRYKNYGKIKIVVCVLLHSVSKINTYLQLFTAADCMSVPVDVERDTTEICPLYHWKNENTVASCCCCFCCQCVVFFGLCRNDKNVKLF